MLIKIHLSIGRWVFFEIIPFFIDVHDEKNEWGRLQSVINSEAGNPKGYGIPAGGGMIFHSDSSVEAVRYNLVEMINEEHVLTQSFILPLEA